MKSSRVMKFTGVLILVVLVGFATFATAGPGRPGKGDYYGRGWDGDRSCQSRWDGHRGAYGYGNLSDEEIQKIEETRKVFYEETKNLRENVYQKRLELRAELAKKQPDAKKALALQKEISDLESQLDQKRLGHHLKIKEAFPDLVGKGFGHPDAGYGPHNWRGFHGRCR